MHEHITKVHAIRRGMKYKDEGYKSNWSNTIGSWGIDGTFQLIPSYVAGTPNSVQINFSLDRPSWIFKPRIQIIPAAAKANRKAVFISEFTASISYAM